MRRGRRVHGQIAQHGAPLLHPGAVVDLVEHGLRPGLVQARVERELAAVVGIVGSRDERPPRQHLGEADHVVLRIPGADAQRVQLQDLAGEVLVEPARAVDAGDRVGPHRRRVVEVEQHGRVTLGGQQQIDEAGEDMRADGFALIGAGHALDLVGRDAEMVRPEPRQPLCKSNLRRECRIDARLDLVEVDLPAGIRHRLGGHLGRHFFVAAVGHGRSRRPLLLRLLLRASRKDAFGLPLGIGVGDRAERLRARLQRTRRNLARARPVELGEQRAAGVRLDGRDGAEPRAEAEPVERERRYCLGGLSHDNASHESRDMLTAKAEKCFKRRPS